jgi:site-specific DNA-cytosine methylase
MRARVLFCGVGGSTEGMVRAGLHVRDAIDGWPIAVERHALWHPSIRAVVGRCEDACDLLPEPVDLVWASPSCRPWSTANRTPRRGKAHPEYYSLARLVAQAFDPPWAARWLVIENVGGLVWSREGKAEMAELAAAVRARARLTWTVTVVRACEHGVRQLRRRPIIVVGPALCPILAGTAGEVDAARAITANRGGTNGSDATRNTTIGTQAHRSFAPVQAVTCALDGGGHPGPGPHRTIRATRGGGRDRYEYTHRSVTASRSGPDGRSYERSVYAQRPGVQSHDPRTGAAYHHESRTLEECADLQQIPMHVLAGLTKTAAYRLVGNAVPPSLAEWVCRCVIAVDARERAA